jgi:hypothetical protein
VPISSPYALLNVNRPNDAASSRYALVWLHPNFVL